ncbi:MAG: YvcK family protein [Clostridiales bacterium]|nr:YvcK family protein [Clostridiales bacterium]MCF8021635.1 YvcK family protein [Clostridiales bacterium]
MKLTKWLYPGMLVKRWLILGLFGLGMVVTGALLTYRYYIEVFPRWELLAALFLVTTGSALIIVGLFKAYRSIVGILAPGDEIVDKVFNRRQLGRGPRIVVIGGGTGISTLLRGLKEYTSNLTAIVTVADDGGSSGRLRGDQGMLAPGDVRNCLVALADKETVMEKLLQYRFSSGELAGHNLGNLLLAALNNVNGGFYEAVKGLSRVLAIRGQVLPATLENVRLCAETGDGEIICGESRIPGSGKKINRIFLDPKVCFPVKEAMQAIQNADAVVLGPGSLYTSVLPNLLVEGIPGALKKTQAVKIYICNIMTQPGETTSYTAADHIRTILDHAGPVVDWTILNKENIHARVLNRYRKEGAEPVRIDEEEIARLGVKIQKGKLAYEEEVVRHHPDRLARQLLHLVLLYRDGGERVVSLNNYRKNASSMGEEKAVF